MEVLYPGKLARWLNLGAGIALLVGSVAVLLWYPVGVVRGVLLLFGLGALALVMRDIVDDALHPKPKLRLHKNGIEGAFGRVDWEDVSSIDFGTRFGSGLYLQTWVILTLHRRPRSATPSGPWSSDWTYRTRLNYPELRLQPWGSRDRVRADIKRYYHGPIEGARPGIAP